MTSLATSQQFSKVGCTNTHGLAVVHLQPPNPIVTCKAGAEETLPSEAETACQAFKPVDVIFFASGAIEQEPAGISVAVVGHHFNERSDAADEPSIGDQNTVKWAFARDAIPDFPEDAKFHAITACGSLVADQVRMSLVVVYTSEFEKGVWTNTYSCSFALADIFSVEDWTIPLSVQSVKFALLEVQFPLNVKLLTSPQRTMPVMCVYDNEGTAFFSALPSPPSLSSDESGESNTDETDDDSDSSTSTEDEWNHQSEERQRDAMMDRALDSDPSTSAAQSRVAAADTSPAPAISSSATDTGANMHRRDATQDRPDTVSLRHRVDFEVGARIRLAPCCITVCLHVDTLSYSPVASATSNEGSRATVPSQEFLVIGSESGLLQLWSLSWDETASFTLQLVDDVLIADCVSSLCVLPGMAVSASSASFNLVATCAAGHVYVFRDVLRHGLGSCRKLNIPVHLDSPLASCVIDYKDKHFLLIGTFNHIVHCMELAENSWHGVADKDVGAPVHGLAAVVSATEGSLAAAVYTPKGLTVLDWAPAPPFRT